MMERSSHWTRRLATALLALLPAGAGAQSELGDVCASTISYECNLAAAAVQVIQPRVGTALWGGNPIPGTAGTAGLRLRASPRISMAARFAMVPATLPPLVDRSAATTTTLFPAFALQSTVALAHGFSPYPTVGGVLSVDAVGRIAAARTPAGQGFDPSAVVGASLGVRLGLLRESFTLPGASVTAVYGRSSRVRLGDPLGGTDGYYEGPVSVLEAQAAVSRRLFGLRFSGGVEWERYGGTVELRYPGAPASGTGATLSADAGMKRWAAFGSVAWSRLIYHAVVEAGWQAPPTVPALPAGVEIDPVGVWLAVALRVTP